MSFVTVYADASFDARTHAAGWAVWIRSDEGRLERSGPCPSPVTSSHHAELTAGYAGIFLAKKRWPRTTRVLVKSDCTGVLPHLEGARTDSRDPVVLRLRAAIAKVPVQVLARWTPGHQPAGSGTPAFLNAQCDRLARAAMRAARVQRGFVPPPDPATEDARATLRELLARRWGSGRGLHEARAWAGKVLGRSRVRIGALALEECNTVIRALCAPPVSGTRLG